MCEKVLKILD